MLITLPDSHSLHVGRLTIPIWQLRKWRLKDVKDMCIRLRNVGQKKQVAYVYNETSYRNVFEIHTYAYMYIRERK